MEVEKGRWKAVKVRGSVSHSQLSRAGGQEGGDGREAMRNEEEGTGRVERAADRRSDTVVLLRSKRESEAILTTTWFCEKGCLIMTTTLYEVEFLLEERFCVGAGR